jgi:ATP-binding cassette subfamily B protein
MLAGYRLTYAGALIAQALAAVAKTTTLLLLAYLIDNVLLQGQVGSAILQIALLFVGLAVVEGTFTFLSGKFAAQTAEGVSLRLRNYLYDQLQRLTFTYHDKMSTGELIQRVTSDVDAVRRFYAEQAIGLGRIGLLFSINLIALISLNLQLALLSIIVVPFVALASFFFFRAISKRYQAFQVQDAILSTTLQENLSGVRVVKAFARQDYEVNKFEGENHKRYGLGIRLMKMHAVYWPLTDIMTGIQMLAGYLIGAIMVIDGTITVGTYLAYVGMIIWIIEPMRGLGRIIVQASTGMVSYERVADMIREEREPLTEGLSELPQPLRGEVAFENVSFHYDGDAEVLRNISFRVEAGQSVALLGSTGSGKTSLVNLLPRFYEYTSGKLTLDGVDVKTISRDFLRTNIGIVEQEPFLFSRSIWENIAYGAGREVTDAEVEAAARAADVHDVIVSFPEGYKTIVGERGVTLSGGQKQRVVIARTLLKNPTILIFDDSTSSVDTETEANIREALDRLMSNRTTFIIAHRVQSVMNADQILVLDKGEIVQRGTHETLVNQPGIYQQIYDLQARIESELEEEIASV